MRSTARLDSNPDATPPRCTRAIESPDWKRISSTGRGTRICVSLSVVFVFAISNGLAGIRTPQLRSLGLLLILF